MPRGQQFLFPLETPLVTRLGRDFFRAIPAQAGVYKMHDSGANVVYVGKARNLRQRLRSYRVANPERMARRHLRMLWQVTRIEFDLCPDETAALELEARLIRELKPKFNRAGVWPGKPRFFTWRFVDQTIELSVQETPPSHEDHFGSLGAYAVRLKTIFAHLLWLATNPQAGFHQMPSGWSRGRLDDVLQIHCGGQIEDLQSALKQTAQGNPDAFTNWLAARSNPERSSFDRAAITSTIEELQEFFERHLAE